MDIPIGDDLVYVFTFICNSPVRLANTESESRDKRPISTLVEDCYRLLEYVFAIVWFSQLPKSLHLDYSYSSQ